MGDYENQTNSLIDLFTITYVYCSLFYDQATHLLGNIVVRHKHFTLFGNLSFSLHLSEKRKNISWMRLDLVMRLYGSCFPVVQALNVFWLFLKSICS